MVVIEHTHIHPRTSMKTEKVLMFSVCMSVRQPCRQQHHNVERLAKHHFKLVSVCSFPGQSAQTLITGDEEQIPTLGLKKQSPQEGAGEVGVELQPQHSSSMEQSGMIG